MRQIVAADRGPIALKLTDDDARPKPITHTCDPALDSRARQAATVVVIHSLPKNVSHQNPAKEVLHFCRASLNIKPKMHHIAVLDDVLFTFQA